MGCAVFSALIYSSYIFSWLYVSFNDVLTNRREIGQNVWEIGGTYLDRVHEERHSQVSFLNRWHLGGVGEDRREEMRRLKDGWR